MNEGRREASFQFLYMLWSSLLRFNPHVLLDVQFVFDRC